MGGDSCPASLIVEESVTITGSDGDTQYLAGNVHRVETTAAVEVGLTEGTDYTVDDDGSGITCESTSASCVDTADLKITYDRQWLDEDADGDTVHSISQPGSATAPFKAISGVPAGRRHASGIKIAAAIMAVWASFMGAGRPYWHLPRERKASSTQMPMVSTTWASPSSI